MGEEQLSLEERRKFKKVDVLLAEYAACNETRDHFDGTAWVIGSIFVAISMSILAATTLNPVYQEPIAVAALGGFSILLFLVWVSYELHVRPWVIASFTRASEIEDELKTLGYEAKLHHNIAKSDEKSRNKGRGKRTFYFLIILILAGWGVRIFLSFLFH
jgi:hypothetical protein